jgi:hypothetical protein
MPRDNAKTVELPTQAIENLPAQAVEKLPDIVAPTPEVRHEEWVGLRDLWFDADSLIFADSFPIAVEPEFRVEAEPTFVSLIEFAAAANDPNDFFTTDNGTSGTLAQLFEGDDVTATYHADTGVDVHIANYNYDDATNIASFDWWIV